VEATLASGQDRDLRSLYDWLRNEPELRGRVRLRSTAPVFEQMGSAVEIVVAIAGPTIPVLIRVLPVWLQQRRSDVQITIAGPGGRKASISAKRVLNPESIIRQVLSELPAQSADQRPEDTPDAIAGPQ
jgi:hypothetical protein